MTNPNEIIVPHEVKNQQGDTIFISHGLTKREYFAAMTMQGFLADSRNGKPEEFAHWSVIMADALIEALNKTK